MIAELAYWCEFDKGQTFVPIAHCAAKKLQVFWNLKAAFRHFHSLFKNAKFTPKVRVGHLKGHHKMTSR